MTNLAMFKATVNDRGEWVNVIPMPFNSVNYSVGHPALSSDEKTLYFVSDMPGSLGQTDIFKVEINDSGFGNPENIGPQFNSSAKEFSPFIDNDVLYFSSDRAGGFGKLDVYAAKIEGFTSSPQLLSEPINSTADDFAYIINSETRKGYFSSNRGGGQGDDDIYAFALPKQNDQVVPEPTGGYFSYLSPASAYAVFVIETKSRLPMYESENKVHQVIRRFSDFEYLLK